MHLNTNVNMVWAWMRRYAFGEQGYYGGGMGSGNQRWSDKNLLMVLGHGSSGTLWPLRMHAQLIARPQG